MEDIFYRVRVYETCGCCGSESSWSSSNYTSFSQARDAMGTLDDWELTTNDPIARYYVDDERINYVGE